jgi:NADH-quinone oxidoreductase subunit C
MSDPVNDPETAMPESPGAEDLGPAMLHGCPVTDSRDQVVLHPSREQWLSAVDALIAEGYRVCADLTAVDYLHHMGREVPAVVSPERFEVVANLLDITHRRRVRLRVQVSENDAVLPSLFDRYPGTEAMEREVFDMFGIAFDGHPDLTRILMPEDWVGHPLRKDYAVGAIPVQFKGAHQ